MSTIYRPPWDEYFLGIAVSVSARADCVRRRVGAVVVVDRRIRATGYNGTAPGEPGCEACPRSKMTYDQVPLGSSYKAEGPGRCYATHAEENALNYCDEEDLIGATLYLTTNPCDDCQELIREAGIARVVWPEGEWIVEQG